MARTRSEAMPATSGKPAAPAAGREMLERVYDDYGAGLIRYARALLGSAEDAEDAVQEVFVRLAREASPIGQIRDMRRYLLRATRNAAYGVLRGRRRLERIEDGVIADFELRPAETENAQVEAVLEAFSELPVEQREVVALKIFQGLTYREIAGVIGKNQNTASSRYRYAIERLRVRLGSDENET